MQEAGAHAIEEAAESEDALRPIKKRARAVMESESEEEEQEEQEEEESLACDECGEERTCELIVKYKGVLMCPGCKQAACSATATAAAAARKAEKEAAGDSEGEGEEYLRGRDGEDDRMELEWDGDEEEALEAAGYPKETMMVDGSNQQVTTSHRVCQYLYDH